MSSEFERFIEILKTLRGPNGCPWDKKQTHQSLKPYMLEEAYEAVHAIDDGDDSELISELGDVLLQVGLHAQIASESGRFTIEDVLREHNNKLVRRHPHVFSSVEVEGIDQIWQNWDSIKAAEKADKGKDPASTSILDGIPFSMPSLMLAMTISKKAARQGFEWPNIHGVLDKMREEIDELKTALDSGSREDIEDEIGDILFTVVNIARWAEVDAEQALIRMVKRFRTRFQLMEESARQSGRPLKDLSAEEWDELWNKAKETV